MKKESYGESRHNHYLHTFYKYWLCLTPYNLYDEKYKQLFITLVF